ncbi:hypothetical protein [Castellaniella sp.]|uniref:hypothetical protein n=1 Tax=Castellaniella sp. TaxID=1955812 RepID=UPI002AFF7CC8|nr:hypothetical protein [Castellaniella sp.]
MKSALMTVTLVAAVVVSSPAAAQSYRLAYSKAENIEIFIQGATQQSWCKPELDLRVVYHDTPDPQAWAGLMPKLGALLDRQCPQATAVSWTTVDAAGKTLAQGVSDKARHWALASTPAASAPAAAQSAATAQADTQAGASPPAHAAGEPAAKVASVAPAVAPTAPVAPSAAAAVSAGPAAGTAQVAVAQAAPAPASEPVPQPQPEPAALTTASAPAFGPAGFAVHDWQPEAEQAVLQRSPFVTWLKDQNGCSVLIGTALGADAQGASLQTKGLNCAPGGRAQGEGSLVLQRSDGARLGAIRRVYVVNGFPFGKPVQDARLVATDGHQVLWFDLGHDQASKTYFLLRTWVADRQPLSDLQISQDMRLDGLTEGVDGFQKAEDIQRRVDAGLAAAARELPDNLRVRLRFSDDLQGVLKEDPAHMMYAINATRRYDSSRPVADNPWQYSLQNARNYAYARAQKEAEQLAAAQQAAEQAAAEKAAVEAARVAAVQALQAFDQAGTTVGDWRPGAEADVLKAAAFLTTMDDQQGCKLRARYRLGADPQFLSLKTKGLSCNAAGYAEGAGSLEIQRSDGAVLVRLPNVYATDGYLFNQPVQVARLVATDGQRWLWFALGYDSESQSYLLLRAQAPDTSGVSVLQVSPSVDGLTTHEASFRKQADIQRLVDVSLSALVTVAMPDARNASVRFADTLDSLISGDNNHMMYAVNAARDWDSRKKQAAGPWKYNLQNATNYVFARAQRKAEEERRQALLAEQQRIQALQQAAMQAQNALNQYDRLVQQSKQDPDSLYRQLSGNLPGYEPVLGGAYGRFYGGRPIGFQQVVHITDQSGDEAQADFPYDLRIAGKPPLADGWYWIRGKAVADASRQDDQGLDMTVVTPGAQGVTACKQDGCVDLTDPLALTRLALQQPDWTPEAAHQAIDQAKNP